MPRSKLTLAAAFCLLVVPSSVSAETIEVSDVAELAAAAAAAVAGDEILIRGGTYRIATSEVFLTNSGTAAQRIVVRAYPGEAVIIEGTSGGPVYVDGDYWEWDGRGMTITYAGTFFQAPGWDGASGEYFYAHHCVATATSGGSDNSGFVYIAGPSAGRGTRLEHNTVIGPGTSGPFSANTSCFYITQTREIEIRNNELSNCPQGIYLKHPNPCSGDFPIVENNFIHDCRRGISHFWNNTTVRHNLFVRAPILVGPNGGRGTLCSTEGGGHNNLFEHNTFAETSITFWNNGIVPTYNNIRCNAFTSRNVMVQYSAAMHYSEMDYNVYLSAGDTWRHDRMNFGLSEWQTYLGGCPGAGNDCGSIVGPVVFTASSPSAITDYALMSGSAGTGLCDDGLDVGADMSRVGPEASAPPPPVCIDGDGDGYGDPASAACAQPTRDCDDSDSAVFPGATEICDDSLDNDCDGLADATDADCGAPCADADADGAQDLACGGTDCDDSDALVGPGQPELCADAVDNDCNGLTDTADPACAAADPDAGPSSDGGVIEPDAGGSAPDGGLAPDAGGSDEPGEGDGGCTVTRRAKHKPLGFWFLLVAGALIARRRAR